MSSLQATSRREASIVADALNVFLNQTLAVPLVVVGPFQMPSALRLAVGGPTIWALAQLLSSKLAVMFHPAGGRVPRTRHVVSLLIFNAIPFPPPDPEIPPPAPPPA